MHHPKQTPNLTDVTRLAMYLWQYEEAEVVEALPERFSEVVSHLYPNGFEPSTRGEIHQALARLRVE